MVKRGREVAQLFHLPDGPQQEKRDGFLGKGGVVTAEEWDGKHIDDPPEGQFNPLMYPYMMGYDVMDHVSTVLQSGDSPYVAAADPKSLQTKRRLQDILG